MGQETSIAYRSAAEEFARIISSTLGNDIDSIVLYGSVVRGEAGSHSDIDVLVISPNAKVIDPALSEICSEFMYDRGFAFFISVVHFSREEFHRLMELGSPFISEILNEGAVLYDNGFFSEVRQRVLASC